MHGGWPHFAFVICRLVGSTGRGRCLEYVFPLCRFPIFFRALGDVFCRCAPVGLSTFRVTAYMGLLTSLTVVSALVVDFLLLPAILLTFDRRPAKYAVPSRALVGAAVGAD